MPPWPATTGMMQFLSREELAGVIAHELAHIKNHDTLTMTVTATIAGAISSIAQFGMFFGGGNRENNHGLGTIGSIAAGHPGAHRRHDHPVRHQPLARVCRRPHGRARFAATRCGSPRRWPRSRTPCIRSPTRPPNRNPATAHLFIINPLTGGGMDNLFSTHPATENRVAALEALAAEMGVARYAAPEQRGGFSLGRRR